MTQDRPRPKYRTAFFSTSSSAHKTPQIKTPQETNITSQTYYQTMSENAISASWDKFKEIPDYPLVGGEILFRK
jgi:hypothetical protein